MIRDWKLLFLKGKPLYDEVVYEEASIDHSSSISDNRKDSNEILEDADLKEYLVRSTRYCINFSLVK